MYRLLSWAVPKPLNRQLGETETQYSTAGMLEAKESAGDAPLRSGHYPQSACA